MSRMRATAQLTLGFGVVTALMLGLALLAVLHLDGLAALGERQYRHPFAVTSAVLRADANVLRMMQGMDELALAGDEGRIARQAARLEQLEQRVAADLALAQERFLGDQAMFDTAREQLRQWQASRARHLALLREGRDDEAALARSDATGQVATLSRTLARIYAEAMRWAEAMQQQSRHERDAAIRLTYVITGLAMLLSIVLGTMLRRGIVRQPGGQARAAAANASRVRKP